MPFHFPLIEEHKDALIASFSQKSPHVTITSFSTGSGKTQWIPNIFLDAVDEKKISTTSTIMVTIPTRIGAYEACSFQKRIQADHEMKRTIAHAAAGDNQYTKSTTAFP